MKITFILGLIIATSAHAKTKDIFNPSSIGTVYEDCNLDQLRTSYGGAISFQKTKNSIKFSTCDKNKIIVTLAECFTDKKDFDAKMKKLGFSKKESKITIGKKTILAGGQNNCVVYREFDLYNEILGRPQP